MPRQRKSKDENSGADLNVTIGDMTATVFPEGVPKNPDGSVIAEGQISVDQARKVGAVSPESAQLNKRTAKTIARKMAGETNIPWGESDAMHLFDTIKTAFPSSHLHIYIQRTEPQPAEEYRPIAVATLKSGVEFYDYVLKNIHKNSPAATYACRFKEANSSERGRGFIRMPDTTMAEVQRNGFDHNQQQFPPISPFMNYPGYAQGYPGYPQGYPGYGQGYPPNGFMGAPPPQQIQHHQAPLPIVQEAAPSPPTPVLPLSVPNNYYQQPPQQVQPQQPQQPSHDPAIFGAMAQQNQEVQRLQQMLLQNQLQLERALGAVDEMRRQNQMGSYYPQPMQPPMQVPIPQQQPQPAAPAVIPITELPSTPQQQQQPVGIPTMPMPPMMMYPPLPPGYAPPWPGYPYPPGYMQSQQVQQPQQQLIPPQSNPLAEIQRATSLISGFSRAMKEIRGNLGSDDANNGNFSQEADPDQEAAEVIPPPDPPFSTMPLGAGQNPPVLAYNKDGSIHLIGTMLGNAPKLVDFVNGITNAIAQAQQVQQHQLNQANQQQHYPQQLQQPQQQPQQQYQPQPQQQYQPQQEQVPQSKQAMPSNLIPVSAFRPQV